MSDLDKLIELIALILLTIVILYVWKKLADSGLIVPYP